MGESNTDKLMTLTLLIGQIFRQFGLLNFDFNPTIVASAIKKIDSARCKLPPRLVSSQTIKNLFPASPDL